MKYLGFLAVCLVVFAVMFLCSLKDGDFSIVNTTDGMPYSAVLRDAKFDKLYPIFRERDAKGGLGGSAIYFKTSDGMVMRAKELEPTVTPTTTPSATPTFTPTATATATATPSMTPSMTPTPDTKATATALPTETPSPIEDE